MLFVRSLEAIELPVMSSRRGGGGAGGGGGADTPPPPASFLRARTGAYIDSIYTEAVASVTAGHMFRVSPYCPPANSPAAFPKHPYDLGALSGLREL